MKHLHAQSFRETVDLLGLVEGDYIHEIIDVGPDARPMSDYKPDNPVVRPLYEKILERAQERGWADENGKANVSLRNAYTFEFDGTIGTHFLGFLLYRAPPTFLQ